MFIGHFAVGFAAKRAAPRLSLAVLFAAAQFADLLWPVLVALGIEQVRIQPGITAFTPLDFVSYPHSHSLLFLCRLGRFCLAPSARASTAIAACVARRVRAGRQPLGARLDYASSGHAAVSGQRQGGPRSVELGPRHDRRRGHDVRHRCLDVPVPLVHAIAPARAHSRRLSAFSSRPMPLIGPPPPNVAA